MKPEFEKYMDLLLEWNEKINLTAITEPKEVEIKHFEDCLTCLKSGYIKDGDKIVDVGTGAGFPGLPIKIENNNVKLTLMDSLNKRINFLKEVSNQLNLDTECIHIRAEEAGKNKLYATALHRLFHRQKKEGERFLLRKQGTFPHFPQGFPQSTFEKGLHIPYANWFT